MRLLIATLSISLSALSLGASPTAFGAPDPQSQLTSLETEWLMAARPALLHAMKEGLPLSVTVQPTSGEGYAPLGLAFESERCRLVLSLRGNPRADLGLEGADADQRALRIELMAVHEMAHCWRRVSGEWGSSPLGEGALSGMLLERSEEAFADMAALAWVQERYPSQAEGARAWLEALRLDARASGAAHQTSAWASALPAASDGARQESLWARARRLWAAGWKRSREHEAASP